MRRTVTRVDREGVPTIVQAWYFRGSDLVLVAKLFNGLCAVIEIENVMDYGSIYARQFSDVEKDNIWAWFDAQPYSVFESRTTEAAQRDWEMRSLYEEMNLL